MIGSGKLIIAGAYLSTQANSLPALNAADIGDTIKIIRFALLTKIIQIDHQDAYWAETYW